LVIFVRSAGLIASEKSRQTLDVLVSTPLSVSAFVGDKLRGLRRAMVVVSVPVVLQAVIVESVRPETSGLIVIETLINLCVPLNLAAQLAFFCGLRAPTQGRAVVTALAVFVSWSAAPLIPRAIFDFQPWVLYLSPLGGLLVTQFPRLRDIHYPHPQIWRLPVPSLLPTLGAGDGIAGFYLLIHTLIYVIVIGILAWLNHDLARRLLVRPRGFSRAPTHHAGLFVED
jgi:hypothetical protein